MHIDHQFDWKGLSFFSKIVGGIFLLAAVAQLGSLYIQSHSQPAAQLTTDSPLGIDVASASSFSSSTPVRVINQLSIIDAIPESGKFIAADLEAMQISLYQDGVLEAQYPIKTKGKSGTPWETPSGFYTIQTKEVSHFSSIGKVYMPYSMQFYGNYFIHGWTTYPDGTPTPFTFSGGCIKMETEDAEKVFAFASIGTKVFVYDPKRKDIPALFLKPFSDIEVTAQAYLVADIDTGDVYAERGAQNILPIGQVTKLLTALVANETISLDKTLTLPIGSLEVPPDPLKETTKKFLVNDLFYPLLMQENSEVSKELASYYGTKSFVRWMNSTALSLGMTSTTIVDPSGDRNENLSHTEDLFRLATYLTTKKSFVFKIANTELKTIRSTDTTSYVITHASTTSDGLVTVANVTIGGQPRHAAIVVLGSLDPSKDVAYLTSWIKNVTLLRDDMSACVACAEPTYRRIEL